MVRRLFLVAAAAALTLGFFYLVGAFVAASFNVVGWSVAGRYFVALIGVLCSVVVAAIVMFSTQE